MASSFCCGSRNQVHTLFFFTHIWTHASRFYMCMFMIHTHRCLNTFPLFSYCCWIQFLYGVATSFNLGKSGRFLCHKLSLQRHTIIGNVHHHVSPLFSTFLLDNNVCEYQKSHLSSSVCNKHRLRNNILFRVFFSCAAHSWSRDGSYFRIEVLPLYIQTQQDQYTPTS